MAGCSLREPHEHSSLWATGGERGRIFDEIRAEADAMIARSRRGIAHDDDKTPEQWDDSLWSLLRGYEPRRMWVKIAALALRAIESIDRKNGASPR